MWLFWNLTNRTELLDIPPHKQVALWNTYKQQFEHKTTWLFNKDGLGEKYKQKLLRDGITVRDVEDLVLPVMNTADGVLSLKRVSELFDYTLQDTNGCISIHTVSSVDSTVKAERLRSNWSRGTRLNYIRLHGFGSKCEFKTCEYRRTQYAEESPHIANTPPRMLLTDQPAWLVTTCMPNPNYMRFVSPACRLTFGYDGLITVDGQRPRWNGVPDNIQTTSWSEFGAWLDKNTEYYTTMRKIINLCQRNYRTPEQTQIARNLTKLMFVR